MTSSQEKGPKKPQDSHVSRAKTSENSSLHFHNGGDGVAPRRKHKRGSVTLSVDVPLETREELNWLCEHLDTTQCPLIQGLVDALYQAEHGRVAMMPMFGDRYIFVEFTQQRVTERLVRRGRGFVRLDDLVEEKHGSVEKCWSCGEKPIFKVSQWVTPSRCHVFYCCREHKPHAPAKLFTQGTKTLS